MALIIYIKFCSPMIDIIWLRLAKGFQKCLNSVIDDNNDGRQSTIHLCSGDLKTYKPKETSMIAERIKKISLTCHFHLFLVMRYTTMYNDEEMTVLWFNVLDNNFQ